ncbi:MAG: hypothetical protein LBS35_00310 [Synergistaceae bacterium]|jgi:hypothetical protein|nr:hypothetical protein [Synergistaceae bacterium]
MADMILDANTLPEPLLKLVRSEKVHVREADGVITMSPIEESELEGIELIERLYGCLDDGKLTVDKFLEMTREDEDIDF